MEKGNVIGVGTILGNTRGDCFRMPIRRSPHPERVVRSPRIRFEELVLRVKLNGSAIRTVGR